MEVTPAVDELMPMFTSVRGTMTKYKDFSITFVDQELEVDVDLLEDHHIENDVLFLRLEGDRVRAIRGWTMIDYGLNRPQ